MKSVPENIYLKTCSTSFPEAQNTLFSILNSLPGVLKVNSCSRTGLSLHRSRWQMPLASASLQLPERVEWGEGSAFIHKSLSRGLVECFHSAAAPFPQDRFLPFKLQ